MGVFDRFKRIVKGNVNAFLDKVEDPERAMEQAVVDMGAELSKAKESLMQSMVDEKKLIRGLDTDRAQAEQWRQKAATFLQAGNEAAAKEALVRAKTGKELVGVKEKELEDHRRLIVQLKTLVDEMGKKIEVAKLKKVELATRAKLAKTAGSVNPGPAINEGDAFREFDRFVGGVEDKEMRLNIERELAGEKIDDELAKAEAKQKLDTADDELEQLKREMGLEKK